MSEVQSRPAPRGRGSARGGRGGFSSRGGRGGRGHTTNGDKLHQDSDISASTEDDGEIAQLKKTFGSKVTTIKDMFPDWTDEDIVLALQETNGDLETTVDGIASGFLTQWGEVSKAKKDRSKSKAKDATSASLGDVTNQTRGPRAGRAGFEGGRGRGRGTDRGRGGGRGGRGASTGHTNGARADENDTLPATTESSAWDTPSQSAWDTPASKEEAPTSDTQKDSESTWDTHKSQEKPEEPQSTAAAAVKAASSIIPDGVKKSWASMFAPAPASKKEKEKAPEPVVEKPAEEKKVEEPAEIIAKESEIVESPPTPVQEAVVTPPLVEKSEPIDITPSKDELTETNLEQVLDTSVPPQTATAASTAASSWDPRNATASSTPIGTQQSTTQPIRPPPTSGFQASALKATGTPGRSASYQRRVLDQEEAVRMPGNREVDRTAVQFGAFNLGSGEEDVDGEREDAETRVQPPQHSPSAPRASLPPAPQQAAGQTVESLPTPKQTSGLPAASAPIAAPGLPSPAPAQNTSGTSTQNVGSFGRYGQGTQESSSLPQKPHDAFGQQTSQSPFDSYSGQSSQAQQHPSGGFSSAPGDFSSYYTSNEQRQAYNNYYQQQYGQGQDGPGSQQRAFGGYGPQSESTGQFSSSGSQQASSRYGGAGEGQNSGHNTPNPTSQSQHQSGQAGQPGHPQHQYGAYGHPYYSSPYYAAYMNQQQQNAAYYNNPYGGKGGHYQQPYQGYGSPYEHASSPAGGVFGGSSAHGRDGTASGGLDNYGRASSAQSSQNQSSIGANNTFGGAHDTFGRNTSYQSQSAYTSQQGNPQGSTDDLKPFGDSKSGSGPSPSLAHAGRPGSATNNNSGSGLPPPQSQQGSYGGYPHLQQGHAGHSNQGNNQYSGLNQAGGHQAGQGHQSPYGGYGGFGYGSTYGGNNQQQRGGWGGNYGH